MNPRIILHLFKTDWQRLRWLIVACWVLLLLSAWPALSFSPGDFDTPVTVGYNPWGNGDRDLVDALEKQGEISPLRDWTFTSIGWICTGVVLFLAGSLGFHTRMWSEGRPVRRRESIAAKTAGLLLLVVIPLAVLNVVIALLHGQPWQSSVGAGLTTSMMSFPRLAGVLLFGALCGSWWSWIAGMFAVALSFKVIPLLLRTAMGPVWFENPLVTPSVVRNLATPLWAAVVVLAAILIFFPRHLPPVRKISMAILAILIACQFTMPGALRRPAPLADTLPDWSSQVRPELKDEPISGTVSNGSAQRGPYRRSFMSLDKKVLNILFSWKPGELPPGTFTAWTPVGTSRLLSGDQVITSSQIPDGMFGGMSGMPDERALTAAVIPNGGKLKWDSLSESVDGDITSEIFDPIEPGSFAEARVEMELAGRVYRVEKIVDVPLGKPVLVKKDGVEIHIRRLDVEGYMPFADVCYVMAAGNQDWRYPLWSNEWIPVIYFPDLGLARCPWAPQRSGMPLAPGLTAVRQFYLTGQMSHDRRDLAGYNNARFMLLKRKDLATIKAQIRTKTLPLDVRGGYGNEGRGGNFDDPPFEQRPDPLTVTLQGFEQWMTLSYSAFNDGWTGRNIADYVPRYLDRILLRPGGVSPPRSPEGEAIVLACPEERKAEVIAALTRTNKDPQQNWIPDVLIRRGWVEEAKPQILKMVAEEGGGENSYSQLMVAMLEDPQTYPALLEQEHWFDIYDKIRRLDGIEPALTEAITRRYRDPNASQRGRSDNTPRDRVYHLIVPAAQGIPEAFSEMLTAWKEVRDPDLRVVAEEIRKVILIPGDPDDWKTVISDLAAKEAADFRYDSLARIWAPIPTGAP